MIRAFSLALLAAAAALPAAAQEPAGPDPERGLDLAGRWCSECHLIGPEGPGGDVGPSFVLVAEMRSEEALRAWLSDPHPPMPKLELSAREVEDIAAYIKSLAP